jgi:hypothetical protein
MTERGAEPAEEIAHRPLTVGRVGFADLARAELRENESAAQAALRVAQEKAERVQQEGQLLLFAMLAARMEPDERQRAERDRSLLPRTDALVREIQDVAAAISALRQPSPPAPAWTPPPAPQTPETLERMAIIDAMAWAAAGLHDAADSLGVTPRKLEERIVAAGLSEDEGVCPACYGEKPPGDEWCQCGASKGWIAYEVSTPHKTMAMERREIIRAMAEEVADLPRAAWALGMHPQKLEERIVATGLSEDEGVCPVCHRERSPDGGWCECGKSKGWIAYSVSMPKTPDAPYAARTSASRSRAGSWLSCRARVRGVAVGSSTRDGCGASGLVEDHALHTRPEPRPRRVPSPPVDYVARILTAVASKPLRSARRVFHEIGGNKAAVFDTVKLMLADGRLVTDSEGVYRVGRRARGGWM